jgi:peroxiredoxin
MTTSPSENSQNSALHRVFAALLIAAIVSILLAGWRWRANAQSRRVEFEVGGQRSVMDLAQLAYSSLVDTTTGQSVQLGISPIKKRLLIFLTAADCSTCLRSVGDWVDLAKAKTGPNFEVDMIYLDTSPSELKSFSQDFKYSYHTFLDTNGDLSKTLNVPKETPVTILVDRDLHILAAEGPAVDDAARNQFIAHVNALVQ